MLRLTSIQAPSADPWCAGLAYQLERRLGRAVEWVGESVPWRERREQLVSGEIQVGWICGLPYVRLTERDPAPLIPLAAPVMAGERYAGLPVYFSDVVVRAESPHRSFADLRGQRWAFNEPDSQSGCGIVRHHLARRGLDRTFFASVAEAGSHDEALRLVLAGVVDAAAIDSTVLEDAARMDPTLMSRLRVIEVLGPSPIPVWVAHRDVSAKDRTSIANAFLTLHEDAEGRAALALGHALRFVAASDADYDPIRQMALEGNRIAWP